jgi:hypothetical protein
VRVLPQRVFLSGRACRRFLAALDSFQATVEAAGSATWAASAQTHLDKAGRRLAEQDLNGAWSHLMAARRAQIPSLRGQELSDREVVLRNEADKVKSAWRKRAIDGLIREPEAGEPRSTEEERARRLESAQSMIDDYYQTEHHKNGLLQDQMRNLLLIGLAALFALLTLIGWAGADLRSWGEWDWKTLLAVLLFGVLGASFSATRRVSGDSGKSKIPEMAANTSITVARTVLGAIPALAAYALLKSEILTVAGQKEAPAPIVFAVAFTAGFSERWVLRLLHSLEGESPPKGDRKDAPPREAAPSAPGAGTTLPPTGR